MNDLVSHAYMTEMIKSVYQVGKHLQKWLLVEQYFITEMRKDSNGVMATAFANGNDFDSEQFSEISDQSIKKNAKTSKSKH